MFETSGGSPTLGAYGDCCSCCAKVRVATPPSTSTLAPHATSVLVMVASLFARARERFLIVRAEPNTAEAGATSPLFTAAPCANRTVLALEWNTLWPTIGPPPNDGGKSH